MKSFHSHKIQANPLWRNSWRKSANATSPVEIMSYDPQGKFACYGHSNGVVELWDVGAIGVAMLRLDLPMEVFKPGYFRNMVWSANSRKLCIIVGANRKPCKGKSVSSIGAGEETSRVFVDEKDGVKIFYNYALTYDVDTGSLCSMWRLPMQFSSVAFLSASASTSAGRFEDDSDILVGSAFDLERHFLLDVQKGSLRALELEPVSFGKEFQLDQGNLNLVVNQSNQVDQTGAANQSQSLPLSLSLPACAQWWLDLTKTQRDNLPQAKSTVINAGTGKASAVDVRKELALSSGMWASSALQVHYSTGDLYLVRNEMQSLGSVAVQLLILEVSVSVDTQTQTQTEGEGEKTKTKTKTKTVELVVRKSLSLASRSQGRVDTVDISLSHKRPTDGVNSVSAYSNTNTNVNTNANNGNGDSEDMVLLGWEEGLVAVHRLSDMECLRVLSLQMPAHLLSLPLAVLGCGFVNGYREGRSMHQNYAESSRLDKRALRELDFAWTEQGQWACVAVGVPRQENFMGSGGANNADMPTACNRLLFFQVASTGSSSSPNNSNSNNNNNNNSSHDEFAPSVDSANKDELDRYTEFIANTQSIALPLPPVNRTNKTAASTSPFEALYVCKNQHRLLLSLIDNSHSNSHSNSSERDRVGSFTLMQNVVSDFPGPMYPLGFSLTEKSIPYIEQEDELDKVKEPEPVKENEKEKEKESQEGSRGSMDIVDANDNSENSENSENSDKEKEKEKGVVRVRIDGGCSFSKSATSGPLRRLPFLPHVRNISIPGVSSIPSTEPKQPDLIATLSAPQPANAAILAYSSRFSQPGARRGGQGQEGMGIPWGLQGSVFASADGGHAYKRSGSSQDLSRTNANGANSTNPNANVQGKQGKLPFSVFLRMPRKVATGEYSSKLADQAVKAIAHDRILADEALLDTKMLAVRNEAVNSLVFKLVADRAKLVDVQRKREAADARRKQQNLERDALAKKEKELAMQRAKETARLRNEAMEAEKLARERAVVEQNAIENSNNNDPVAGRIESTADVLAGIIGHVPNINIKIENQNQNLSQTQGQASTDAGITGAPTAAATAIGAAASASAGAGVSSASVVGASPPCVSDSAKRAAPVAEDQNEDQDPPAKRVANDIAMHTAS